MRATGITHRTLRQIERARHAAILLTGGTSILDTVEGAGYFDQAHLTRSVKTLIGATNVRKTVATTMQAVPAVMRLR